MPFPRCTLILCFAFSAAAATACATQRPPNIVLILADDLGVFDLGCYGRTEHRTPQLDRLAAQGVRCTSAYAPQAICSPSRAALMTGKCPARLHLTNYLPGRPDAASQKLLQPRIEGQLPLEETTLAELLRGAGYATGMFGKWHLGGAGFGPTEQGFDAAVAPPANTNPTPESGGKGEFAITAAAEAFIEQHRDRPFFCYVPHNNPHIPLAADPQRIAHNADAFHPVYAAMIETLDDAVGRLLAKLDALGLTEQTIVIFTSDNGGLHVLEFPGTPATHHGPLRAGKGYLYEGGIRVPFLVRWPGVTQPGSVSASPLVLTDLVPTLLRAAGIDPDRTAGPLDGEDITPLLRGEQQSERRLLWHFPHYTNQGGRPAGAVRQGNWKFIEQYEDGAAELYDLTQDPGEQNNLAADRPQLAAELREQLHAWRVRVGAQQVVDNPDFDAAAHRRLYVEQDSSRLSPLGTAAATAPAWTTWRQAMNAAAKGRAPRVTPANGDIRLLAQSARVHGQKLRYEPEPHKNVLGYWTEADDWADWAFEVSAAGVYEIEIQLGCGDAAGGSQVVVEIAGREFPFEVTPTGHYQQMISKVVGQVELPAGRQTLAVRPRLKAGAAVMDLRLVVLRPNEP